MFTICAASCLQGPVKYKVIVKTAAKADFRNIHSYLKERLGKRAAARFKTTYGSILKSPGHMPRMFEAVQEMPGIHDCSALSTTLVPHEVFEQEKRVEILALHDGRIEPS